MEESRDCEEYYVRKKCESLFNKRKKRRNHTCLVHIAKFYVTRRLFQKLIESLVWNKALKANCFVAQPELESQIPHFKNASPVFSPVISALKR